MQASSTTLVAFRTLYTVIATALRFIILLLFSVGLLLTRLVQSAYENRVVILIGGTLFVGGYLIANATARWCFLYQWRTVQRRCG